jgi:hypothetical protein
MHCVLISGVTAKQVVRELSKSKARGLLQTYRVVSRPPRQEYSPAVVRLQIKQRTNYVKIVTSVEAGWPFLGVVIERCGWTAAAVRYSRDSVVELQIWTDGREIRHLRALLDEHWTWYAKGPALPFEERELYRRRRIRDRLSGTLVERYLTALGFHERVDKEPGAAATKPW